MKAIAIAASLIAGHAAVAADCTADRLTVAGGFGQATFDVRIADDDAEREQGLMNVESMGTLEGMLFVYDTEGPASFWMENTLIPLDLLFADATGTIVTIHPDAVPMDRTPIPGGDRVKFVLEVNGGLAQRLGVAVGDAFRHPAVGEGAALPCD